MCVGGVWEGKKNRRPWPFLSLPPSLSAILFFHLSPHFPFLLLLSLSSLCFSLLYLLFLSMTAYCSACSTWIAPPTPGKTGQISTLISFPWEIVITISVRCVLHFIQCIPTHLSITALTMLLVIYVSVFLDRFWAHYMRMLCFHLESQPLLYCPICIKFQTCSLNLWMNKEGKRWANSAAEGLVWPRWRLLGTAAGVHGGAVMPTGHWCLLRRAWHPNLGNEEGGTVLRNTLVGDVPNLG